MHANFARRMGRATRWLTPRGADLLTALVLTGALAAGGASGCTKKDSGAKAVGLPPAPPGSAPPVAPAAPAGTPAAPGAAAPTGKTITGRIVLPDARKANVAPNDVVYLIARRVPDNPTARGALVAVKRFTASSFPIDYTLSEGDMMFKNGPFEGNLQLSVRVDKDGDPMTRRKGDVFGILDSVAVGSSGIDIKLDHVQEQDESLLGGSPPHAGLPPGHP